MKQLAIMLASVAILLGVWIIIGKSVGTDSSHISLIIPKDVTDKAALVRSADQFWRATPGYYDPYQCAALLGTLAEALGDEHWRAVAPPVLFAWDSLRDDAAARGALAGVGQKVFPRIARAGSRGDLETMIRLANTNAFDHAAIDGALSAASQTPVAVGGYPTSRLSDVVAAAIGVQDYSRAQEYLARIRWEGDSAPAELPAEIRRTNEVIVLCQASEKGQFDFSAAARLWQAFEDGPVERTVLRPAVEGIALRAMNGFDPIAPKLPLEEYFMKSVGQAGGVGYWGDVLGRFVHFCTLGDEAKNGTMGLLLPRYEAHLKKPGYAFETWMKAGQKTAQAAGQDHVRAVKLYERALAAAPSDESRVRALKGIVSGYLKANEFPRARKAAEQALGSIKDVSFLGEAQALLDEAKLKCAEDDVRVAKQEKAIDEDRTRGRLKNMKDMLVQARKVGRPSDELRAIEKAIQDLERRIAE